MNIAILLHGDDWEGLYINGRLVEQGHNLEQGDFRLTYFKKLSKKYCFDIMDIKEFYITNEDMEYIDSYCGFPEYLDRLSGAYL